MRALGLFDDPNPLFSTSWYLTTYSDIGEAGLDPLVHYLEYGEEEGRDPEAGLRHGLVPGVQRRRAGRGRQPAGPLPDGYTLSWLASDAEAAVAPDLSDADAARLRGTPLGEVADLWRDPATRDGNAAWSSLAGLSRANREALAAGFEYLGR